MIIKIIKNAIAVLKGRAIVIDKSTSFVEFTVWQYNISGSSYKDIYFKAAMKLKEEYEMALTMSNHFQI